MTSSNAAGPASSLEQRRATLFAALAFAQLDAHEPAVDALKSYLNSWRGVGDVVVGMNRHGYKLPLTQLDATTWRAMFHRDFLLAQDGFGADRTPWGAVRLAAWSALRSAVHRAEARED